MITTVGQLLVNAGLPKELQAYDRVLDKRGLESLLQRAAKLGPEVYRDVAQHLATVGWQAAQATGANSFGPEHVQQSVAARMVAADIRDKIRKANQDANLSDGDRERQLVGLLRGASDDLTRRVLQESVAEHNPLAMQIISGSRGNPTNLRSLRGMDLLYVDHKNRPIPVPILRSYSQGLTPAQYFASTFGARKGVVDTKFCLAPWTLVRTWDGRDVPLQDLRRGDSLVTFDFSSYSFVPTTILRVFDNGLQRCFRFFFEKDDGSEHIEIVATNRHRVFVRTQEDYPQQLKLPLAAFMDTEIRLEVAIPSETLKYKLGPTWRLAYVQAVGVIPTLDIMVSGDSHLFLLANGAVVSNSVRNAGFASKQFNQLSHRLVVSADDDTENSEAATLGLPVETSDPESEGSLLAMPAGGYARNTVLTPRILADLQAKGVKDLLVRSSLTSHHPLGGIYAKDAGVREHGRLPVVGENIGIASAQALSEPLTQMTLQSKHSGGVASSSRLGGFELLNQQVQVPSIFKGGAAHAQLDGKITGVREAPQGGSYIEVNGKEHYVGRGFKPLVKVGDDVEAGDVLSEGTPNPAELVRHKHIGEGARQFVNNFRRAYTDSNAYGHRRNIESLARGLINHVQLTEELDTHVPGDIVPYSTVVRAYQPRDGHKVLSADRAAGMYLERPVLHYSIGTQLKPSVLRMLQKFAIPTVTVHASPPPFTPIMVRAMDSLSHDPDWMTRFLGSNVKKNLLAGVHKGHVSDEAGSSYVPSLARGIDFGKFSPIISAPLLDQTPRPPVSARSILDQMQAFTKAAVDEDKLLDVLELAEDDDPYFYDDDNDEDDDDDDCVCYCGRHVAIPGYEDELGRRLTMLVGDDGDQHGAFRLFSDDLGRVYTKPFCRLTPEQYDSMARGFGRRLAEWPVRCRELSQLYRLLQSFKVD